MSKHLNELSAVYLNNIAEETVCPVCGFDPCQCLEGTLDESCGCDHSEKKDKKKEKKEYKDPVSHALETDKKLMKIHNEGKQPIHIGRMLSQASNKDYQASKEKNPSKREKLETQARTIRTTVDMDSFKKRKSLNKPQRAGVQEGFSNWREDLIEVVDVPSSEAQTDDKMNKEIKEKKVKNKVVINPPQGVTEAVAELGGVILEFHELDEKINMKKADMGDVVKDFYKSDAPQFKGKSKEKRRQMAIAAKLSAERGPQTEERDPAKEAEGKKIAGYERSGRAFGLIKKFRQENPGSRQPKKVRGAKETEGQAENRRRGAQAQRAAKYGLTSKEKKETQARAPYYSTRD